MMPKGRSSVAPTLPIVLGLPHDEAAAALGLSRNKFDLLVRRGLLPPPRDLDGVMSWDVAELHEAYRRFPHSGQHKPKPDEIEGAGWGNGGA